MNDVLKNPKWKLICIDIDWTVCKWEFRAWMEDPEPLLERIKYFNGLYNKWWHIIMYTARQPNLYQTTLAWLIKHWVMFHWIAMRYKPWADLYIDDKAINVVDL